MEEARVNRDGNAVLRRLLQALPQQYHRAVRHALKIAVRVSADGFLQRSDKLAHVLGRVGVIIVDARLFEVVDLCLQVLDLHLALDGGEAQVLDGLRSDEESGQGGSTARQDGGRRAEGRTRTLAHTGQLVGCARARIRGW